MDKNHKTHVAYKKFTFTDTDKLKVKGRNKLVYDYGIQSKVRVAVVIRDNRL